MKLLNPTQVQDLKAQEQRREAIRIIEYEEVAEKARKDFNQAEADFMQLIAGQRQRLADEEMAHEKRVREMVEEIGMLERKKVIAMEPIEALQIEVETAMLNADNLQRELVEKQEYCDEITEKMQDKLDEMGGREQDIISQELKLIAKEKNSNIWEESIKTRNAELIKIINNFNAERIASDKDIDRRKMDLVMIERTLLAKSESIKGQEQKLKQWEIRLRDQRDTLERAFKRISPLNAKEKDSKI